MGNKQQNHYHFRWAPTSKGINFDRLSHNFVQVANHLEGHSELSRKHELFKNIRSHLDGLHKLYRHEAPHPMLFQVMPLQFHIKLMPAQNQMQANPLAPFIGMGLAANQQAFWDNRNEKVLKSHLKQQM